MNDWNHIPPGQIWIPVYDLPSALAALEFLIEHILSFDSELEPPDYDEL